MMERGLSKAEIFRLAYERLATSGRCDCYGGAESRRVWRDWEAAGYPQPVEHFIVARANIGPDGDGPASMN
jgi:hypothetical protein